MKEMIVLEVQGVTKNFGGVTALKSCSLTLDEPHIYGLIGPNGSGKTTLFNVITGYLKPDEGRIAFMNNGISGLDPYQISRMGVARTFQLTRVFAKLTAIENLIAASRRGSSEEKERAFKLLDLVGLGNLVNEVAKSLNPAQQKRLEFARALMLDPKLLLLDEPTAGLDIDGIEAMLRLTREANRMGRTVLIVEHNMSVIMETCQKIFVMDSGQKIAEGSPDQIRNDERVIKAYLGEAF